MDVDKDIEQIAFTAPWSRKDEGLPKMVTEAKCLHGKPRSWDYEVRQYNARGLLLDSGWLNMPSDISPGEKFEVKFYLKKGVVKVHIAETNHRR